MKKTIKYIAFGFAGIMAFSACSEDFMKEKKNYDNVNEGIYDYVEGCEGRLNDLYAWCLPCVGDVDGTINRNFPVSMGNADLCAKSTEEYTGFSKFVDPQIELTSMSGENSVPDFFAGQPANIQASVYGRIRNVNDVIKGIQNGSLSDEEKQPLLGQAYFMRAWCYFNLFRWYGGVPLVDEILEPVEGNYTPRSSAKATKDFILADLDRAAKMLTAKSANGGWPASSWGRVTSGTALALKGRVLLWWCSPIYNRKSDYQDRWKEAYQEMKQDLADIDKCGYGLYQSGSNVNGSDFAGQFLQSGQNPEAVFITLYNNIEGDGLDNQKNNGWEKAIRPKNTGGSGKKASLKLIQMFPMADGRIPANTDNYTNPYSNLETSQYALEDLYPFMNRDPRFYRTFAFPGFRWAYNGDASSIDPKNPSDGKNFVIWNYVWFTEEDAVGNPEKGDSYGADNLLSSKVGVYVRKKSDDLDVNSSNLYQYITGSEKGAAPFYSAAPLIELRYAEVLLNLAEAACMAGDMPYAVEQLQKIRARAGYTAENNYGLQANLTGNQQACMSAILYERQIEFAYEGKRFDDLRRWMLFDGGVGQEALCDNWKMEAYGGNTCTWLGFTPMNNQRRENIEFATAAKYGVGGTTAESDPLVVAGVVRPAGVDFRQADINTQLETLKAWYQDNLRVAIKYGDARDSQHNLLYINYRPKYYILGLSNSAQTSNKDLPQTIGWQDYNKGGAMGTFDPLAE